jgi:KUP system potassium uptake protein
VRDGEATHHQTESQVSLAALSLGALGVVFGDIGTSPLYTLRECMMAAGGAKASANDLYGILSLMFWSLILVVTVKYLAFVMRADHDGEGGIFALLAIVPERFRTATAKTGKVTGMALLAVIGAALLFGDGVITPAISVLSAVEGLAVASPKLSPIIVPLTCLILVGLFSIQRRGTGDVGKLFGPVMAVVVWRARGTRAISHRPATPNSRRTFSPLWRPILRAPRTSRCADSRIGSSGGNRGRGLVR